MAPRTAPPTSASSNDAFGEGVAAVRRAVLTSGRSSDAISDILKIVQRHLRCDFAGVWVGRTRQWQILDDAAPATLGKVSAARDRGGLRDGVLRVGLVGRGRDLGVLVGVWGRPAALDLMTCARFEELGEYATMALLLDPGGRGTAAETEAPTPTASSRSSAAGDGPTPASPAVPPPGSGRSMPSAPAEWVPSGTGAVAAAAPAAPSPVAENGHTTVIAATRTAAPRVAVASSPEEEQLQRDLRSAVMADRILPHYQPIIRFADGRVIAFEALARWEHPERGWVAPAEFIPAAERSGLIATLGMRILNAAARQAGVWSRSPEGADVRVILNLSPVQLASRSLVTEVGCVIRRNGLSAGRIVLELTGDADLGTAKMAALLERFEGAGIQIAMDDPSMIEHLRSSSAEVAASFVKVPRRLVGSAVGSGEVRREIEAIVAGARAGGRTVVAEGVEIDAELSILRSLGVEAGQGFLWSAGIPASEATAVLERQPWSNGR